MSDTPMVEVSDLLGLSQPLSKLIEVCASGLGTLYKPVHMKRMAKAQATEIDEISAAVIRNENIPINYQQGNVGIDSSDTEALIMRAKNRALFQQVKAQNNIESVVANASTELKAEESVSDNPVDEDWITRFFNIAKDVNSDDMQHIWGKILAGEVRKPGSFSLRTLETIRNISKTEAEIFSKIIPLVFRSGHEYFITSDNDILLKNHVYYSQIMLLDECGLMASDVNIVLRYDMNPKSQGLMANDHFAIIYTSTSSENEEISFGIYSLTKAGKELYDILAHESNEQYCFDLAENIFKKNRPKLDIAVHPVIELDEKGVQYDTPSLREYCEKKGAVQESNLN